MKRLINAAKLTAIISFAVLGVGCAIPITYYSNAPDANKTGKVHFISQGGTYSTISLYEDYRTCKGIQRLTFFEPGVDRAVYVPHGSYVTFSAYIQFPGAPSFSYGNSMYSIPFEDGNLRISISYSKKSMFTRIERQDSSGHWVLVKDAVEREARQPFSESGAWCKPAPELQ